MQWLYVRSGLILSKGFSDSASWWLHMLGTNYHIALYNCSVMDQAAVCTNLKEAQPRHAPLSLASIQDSTPSVVCELRCSWPPPSWLDVMTRCSCSQLVRTASPCRLSPPPSDLGQAPASSWETTEESEVLALYRHATGIHHHHQNGSCEAGNKLSPTQSASSANNVDIIFAPSFAFSIYPAARLQQTKLPALTDAASLRFSDLLKNQPQLAIELGARAPPRSPCHLGSYRKPLASGRTFS